MLQPWVGPYTIVRIVNSNIELSSSNGKILNIKANISNLKHYIEDTVKKIAHYETIEGVQDQVCRLLKTIVGEGEEEALFEEMSCGIKVSGERLEFRKVDTKIKRVKRKDTFGEKPIIAIKSIVREEGYIGVQDQDDQIILEAIIPKKIEIFTTDHIVGDGNCFLGV
ncbi:unnamed protein product [Gordionus sp. m RMFG-2023]